MVRWKSPVWIVAVLVTLSLIASACGRGDSTSNDETSGEDQSRQAADVLVVAQGQTGGVQGVNAPLQASPTPGSFGPIVNPTAWPTTAAPTVEATLALTATATATLTVTPGPSPTPTLTSTATVTPAETATPTPSPTETLTPTPAATATLPGTPLPALRIEQMGIQIDSDISMDDYEVALWHAQNLGMRWVKLQFAWDILEPTPNEFSDVMYRYRLFVQKAHDNGFKVLVSIAAAPDWARSTTEENGPPSDPSALASMITRMLGEIRTDYLGQSYIAAIEVWNEPNLMREWHGGTLNGADYMRYFSAAYNVIRAAEDGPNITVVTAGLAPTGVDDGVNAVDDRRYLQQMYQAGLTSDAYQNIAIGVHPYGAWNPPDARCCINSGQGYDDHPTFFFLDTLEDYHNIMLDYGDTTHQLWPTEFGWATYDNLYKSDGSPAVAPESQPFFNYLTEEQQANYIMRGFELGQSLPYVGVMMLWNLNFAYPTYVDASDPRAGYSVWGTMPDPERFAYTLLSRSPRQ